MPRPSLFKDRVTSNFGSRASQTIATLERDDYTCQGCGERHKDLIVHHIDGSSKIFGINKQNNNLDNLITLCVGCHRKVHNRYLHSPDILKSHPKVQRDFKQSQPVKKDKENAKVAKGKRIWKTTYHGVEIIAYITE